MVKVAVCGCGFLGSSIAGCLLNHGHDVVVYDINERALDSFPTNLRKLKDDLVKRGLILDKPFLGQYYLVPELEEAIKDVDFVIEAIQEDVGVKRAFFQRVSNTCSNTAILLTSSINLHLDEIFALTNHKERSLGLRFLHPVFFVQDVEVRYHEKTSEDVKEKVTWFVEESLKKTIFMRTTWQRPLVLADEAIRAMEEARRVELRRLPSELPHQGDYQDEVDAVMLGGQGDRCSRPFPICHGATSNQVAQRVSNLPSVVLPLRSIDSEMCRSCNLRPTMCVLSPCLHHICKECAKSMINRQETCKIQSCGRSIQSYQTIGSP